MKTVIITEDFDGYPQGRDSARPVHYATGQEVEVSNEFADLLLGKGLAREKTEEAEAQPSAKRGAKS